MSAKTVITCDHCGKEIPNNCYEKEAHAVLRAFGNSPPGQTTQTNAADALRRVRDRIDYGPTENWRGDMRRIIDDELAKLKARPVQLPPDTSTDSGLPDAVIAAITLPTKPTKPLRERLEELAAYWYMGDKDDKELNGARRLARKECAKELREVINDPR